MVLSLLLNGTSCYAHPSSQISKQAVRSFQNRLNLGKKTDSIQQTRHEASSAIPFLVSIHHSPLLITKMLMLLIMVREIEGENDI